MSTATIDRDTQVKQFSPTAKPVQVKILNPIVETFGLPTYATEGSAGLDLRAAIEAPTTIAPGETKLIPTGIAVYLADPAYAGLILPRSGLGHKQGLVLGNLVGLIDADYQGELKISCWNRGNVMQTLEPGMRLAQYVVVPVQQVSFETVDEFVATDRGTGGFGSTGKS